MAGEAVQRRPWWHPATILGSFTRGNYPQDKTVKAILSAGFAGALCILLLREWRSDREAERTLRQQQHGELVAVMKEQHAEDVKERRLDRCVSANLNDTVRSAIWKERPRPREECK